MKKPAEDTSERWGEEYQILKLRAPGKSDSLAALLRKVHFKQPTPSRASLFCLLAEQKHEQLQEIYIDTSAFGQMLVPGMQDSGPGHAGLQERQHRQRFLQNPFVLPDKPQVTQTITLTETLEAAAEVRMSPSHFCPWGTQRQKRLTCSSQSQVCCSARRSRLRGGDGARWRRSRGLRCHFPPLFSSFGSAILAPPPPLPLSGTADSRPQSGTGAASGPGLRL